MVEILKQNQYVPLDVEKQVAMIWAGNSGYLDDVPMERVKEFEEGFYSFMEANYASVMSDIRESGRIDTEGEESLKKAVNEFKNGFMTTA